MQSQIRDENVKNLYEEFFKRNPGIPSKDPSVLYIIVHEDVIMEPHTDYLLDTKVRIYKSGAPDEVRYPSLFTREMKNLYISTITESNTFGSNKTLCLRIWNRSNVMCTLKKYDIIGIVRLVDDIE